MKAPHRERTYIHTFVGSKVSRKAAKPAKDLQSAFARLIHRRAGAARKPRLDGAFANRPNHGGAFHNG